MNWRLMIFDVPDRLSGLLARLGFRATKKSPSHWWRVFDPATDKEAAEVARHDLLAAGLEGRWSRVEAPRPTGRAPDPHPYVQRGGNWNTGVTARLKHHPHGRSRRRS